MKYSANLLFFFVIASMTYSQVKVTEGSLIAVNFMQQKIDSFSVVSSWKAEENPNLKEYIIYENVFKSDGTNYTVRRTNSLSVNGYFPDVYSICLINLDTGVESLLISGIYPWCGTGIIYHSPETTIFQRERGALLNYDLAGQTRKLDSGQISDFSDINDSLRIVHIAGVFNNKYLIAANDQIPYPYKIILADFGNDGSSIITSDIYFKDAPRPLEFFPSKIIGINDSLAFITSQYENKLYIGKFTGHVVSFVDSVEINNTGFWTYKNNKLYFSEISMLMAMPLDTLSLKLGTKVQRLEMGGFRKTNISEDYLSTIRNDTLIVYSLLEDKIIANHDISWLNDYSSVCLDYPNVYFQKTDKITSKEEFSSTPVDFTLGQNYPNPFNPETTIKYSVPTVEKLLGRSLRTKLAVYDILGREVTVLVNEDKSPGTYEVKFNARNAERIRSITSGVYFYKLTCGSFSQTKKFIILK